MTKMHSVMQMTFNKAGQAYRDASGNGQTLTGDNPTAVTGNFHLNEAWDPSKAHKDETPANIKGGKYRMADTDGTIGDTYTYKYQQVTANPDDLYYQTAPVAAVPGRTVMDWNTGLVVSMSGVSIGGSYRVTDHDNAADDTVQYDVGIMYGEGPWAVSANYGNTSQDDDGEGKKTDTDFSRLMATYNLGPGVNMAGVLGSDSPDNGQDTTFAAMALLISF